MGLTLKELLEKSGAVIAVAEMARDGIVERINKDLEHQLVKARQMLGDKDSEIFELRAKLRTKEKDLDDARNEVMALRTAWEGLKLDVAGLKMRIAELEEKETKGKK